MELLITCFATSLYPPLWNVHESARASYLRAFGCHEHEPLWVTLLALGITSHGGWVAVACWQP